MYVVTKDMTNGYRCSCCSSSWDDTDWYDTLEEALDELPVEPLSTGDIEMTEVEIKDGSTGEVVAWGKMHWSSGYGKYSGYKFTCWTGYRPDTGEFERITDKQGKVIEGKTWKQILAELGIEKAQKDFDEATKKVEEAQKALENAKKRLAAALEATPP